jgi:hypothetical protein
MLQTWTWTTAGNICLVEGHIPMTQWAGSTPDDEPPPGVSTTCVRCGAELLSETEIPSDE